MAKLAGENSLAGLSVYLGLLRRRKALLHTGVIYSQKLRGSGNHVDVVVLTFGALPVHKSINWIVRPFLFQDGHTHLKQSRAQVRRPAL